MTATPIVFCIAGRTETGSAGAGKDTAADMIVDLAQRRGLRAIKVGLADRLKAIARKMIAAFYGIDMPLADFYDEKKKEEERPDLPPFMGRPFKLRTILQYVGTEIIRDHIWPDVWCDIVYRAYIATRQYDVIAISDCRFPNEVTYFKAAPVDCRVWRINRSIGAPATATANQQHRSETGTLSVDIDLDNNGTLDELRATIEPLVEHAVNRRDASI